MIRKMARQGDSLTEEEIKRIVTLLADTDMAIFDISQRMGRSRSAIIAVNRRFQVRKYDGQRTAWTMETMQEAEARGKYPI
ncbi:MAG TPA: hypothetical protein VGK48_00845 [Terriglobia bacterium]